MFYIDFNQLKDFEAIQLIKISLIILSFVKIINMLRVFEKMAFFIKLIIYCLMDLVPFLISYLSFMLFFSLLYIALDTELDPEFDSTGEVSYFGKIFLMVWRNSVSKLSFPMYGLIMQREPDGAWKALHILLIYLVHFV